MDNEQEITSLASPYVECSIKPRINLAFQQNSVPVISELSVFNPTETNYENLTLRVETDPPFAKPREWAIDRLLQGSQFHIPDVKLDISSSYLSNLKEATRGCLTVSLLEGDNTIHTSTQEVEILAKDEWGGNEILPEIISAFIQPNDPAVEIILREASKRLRSANLDGSFDGYQSNNPKRVGTVNAAIWSAIAGLQLSYAVPPASFEKRGQKIRTPSRIYESRLATCLDLSLLFASCLEQAGLNPIVIFTEGHVFVGCWLQDGDFSSSVIDDVQAIRKRVQLHELIVFETTLVTDTPPKKFQFAYQEGVAQLKDEAKFDLAIDVKRARLARIRPISDTDGVQSVGGEEEIDLAVPLDIPVDLPDETSISPDEKETVANTPVSRLERWKRKLLDLSLRNRMLNFNPTKRAIAIECSDIGKLEDLIADGKILKILPMPDFEEGVDPRSERLHKDQHQEDLRKEYTEKALERGELLVAQDAKTLEGQLIELYRSYRSSIQEGGSNTLYIAIGFLVWQQKDKSGRKFKAPLIMIPVQITRKSVGSGFRVVIHEDDPQMNPTLLEMLRQDFNLRISEFDEDLPKDEHGLDVDVILNIMRRAIRDLPGWEVVDNAILSTFSFSKYLMWRDLESRVGQLKNNPVVKHLLDSPRDQYLTNRSGFPNKERLDDERPPEKTYCPLVADSSQLAAVIAATEGMDFVLLGPPGTGKSQTISNMISQCLAEGKTVLFVSEKMAALDVVHRRLKETGIGEFCLELHSNKARGATVLQQLKQAMEIKGDLTAIKWQEEANRLKTLRDRLNLYVRRLHHNYPNGWSVYRAIGEVVFNQDLPKIAFSWASIHKHNIADFNDLLDIAKRIDANSEQVGEIINNPFRDVLRGEWSPSWQADLITAAKDMMPTVSELRHAFKQYLNVTSLQISQPNYNQLQNILRLNKLLLSAYTMPFGFAVSPKSSVIVKDVKNAIQHLKNYRKSWDSLTTNYKRTVTELNIEELENDWNTANTFWWGKKWVWQNRIRKCMQIHVENNKKPDSAEKEFSGIKNAAKYEAEFNKLNYLSSHLDKLWSGLDTDIKGLNSAVEWGEQAQKLIEVFSYNADTLTSLKSSLSKLIVEGNDLLSPKGILEQCGDALELKVNEFNSSLNKVLSLTDAENGLLFSPEKNNYLECIEQQCQDWLNSETKLRYWCAWRGIRQKAIGASLGNLVLAIENGQTLGHSSEKLFQVNYSRWFLNKAVDQDDVLRTFVPAEHEHWLKEFKQLDRDFLKLTSQYVRAKISGQIPDDHDGPQREEWSTLNRELQKRSRHLPLRKLIQKMPTTLTKVAPCLMMSPLSIAQFLPAETVPFDVVIFDEASQITSWDAVGAIARGKQTIVVGDPKQLPPTSFFQRRDDESPDQDTEMEDLESILDECVGARIPVLELNWHYRSRSEHLITFSNHRYYSGRLVTFPSANTDDKAVQYHYVENSVYARGGGRINEVEGKAIVNAVVDRLRDSNFVDTIGIVTFNTEQQTLIEDLFEKKRKEYPEIESHFAEDKIESIFVKNIESVQGDERDIIYFSLTYGRDIKGVFSMNFGPINKAGGQRRLNVAITRSRKEMHVFSGMRPEEMDLSRTNSEGVKDLKHFMEFADRGPRALAEVIDRPLEDYDSPFEEAVACALSDRGWIVHSQVGVSSFRIDLGVVNPDEQGSYLAGVECDGATYHRSATARDRDLLREQVLIGLGWNILRIWSTDWWTDPIGATEKIHKSLEGLLEDSRNIRRAEEAEKNAQTQADSNVDVNNEQKPDSDEVVSDFSPGLISDDALEIKNEEPNTHPQKESVSRDEFSLVSEPHQGKLNITSKENIVSEPIDQKAYSHEGLIINQEPYITFEAADLADPSSSSKGKISEGLCRIVEVEGPMLAKKAYDIYLRSCGIRRLGGTLQKTMNKAMQYAIRCGKIEKEDESKKGGIIYSIVRANNTSPIKLRRLGTRSFDEIPPSELQVASRIVKSENAALGDDENLRDVLSFYGLKRMTSTVKSNFMEAIKTRFIHVEEYFGQSNKPGVPDLEKELETSKVAIDQDVKILTKIPHNETGYEIVLRSTDASVICTITISSHMVTNEEENFYNYDHPFSQNLNGKGVGDEVAHPLYGGNFKIIKISTSQQTENKDDLSGPSKYFPKS